ncbi:MAG: 4Fe-4S dicluster domain-containing protein [Candidatus Azobacteroides pseudotrichonymphae]|jgi:NADH-quinone oxidoreductase subunit I|nr:4Fe-4S dicluster domain-containing protein [Bacteroidales bacterium OttesenSCG-928-I14]GMO32017.1 MAG: 4Fe-4S dicluster domain-containing protein [Candidatus Azobacteroides pseudotrichonymphae]
MNQIKNIIKGIWHLVQGMYITMLNFLRKKVTEQYPEDREKVFRYERMRGQLVMSHNEKNQHKCTVCGICQANCPNGTIRIITKKELDEVTEKEKKTLDKYIYDIGSCTFCSICTISCPQNAILWTTNFEHATFTRSKLYMKLNKEGSTLTRK